MDQMLLERRNESLLKPELAENAWQRWLLCIGTLYSLLLIPVWDSALVPLMALSAFLLACYFGAARQFWQDYRKVVFWFSLLVALNTSLSPLPVRAGLGAVYLLRGLLLILPAIVLMQVTTPEQRSRALSGIIAVASLVASGLLIWVWSSAENYQAVVVFTGQYFGNLHNLASATAMVLIAALVWAWVSETARQRIGWLLVAVPLLVLMLTLRSEGTLIALCMVVAGVAMLFGAFWLRLLAFLGILSLVAALHLLYLYPAEGQQILGMSLGSVVQRVQLYEALVQAWQQSPWFGWGMNTYKYLPVSSLDGVSFIYPHHIYLEALFSVGVVGLLLMVLMLRALGHAVDWHYVRRQPIALIAFLILCYLAGKGMTDMKLFPPRPSAWLRCAWG